jgi:hypothetical protein
MSVLRLEGSKGVWLGGCVEGDVAVLYCTATVR